MFAFRKYLIITYRIVGKFGGGWKFGKFGKLFMIRQTKTMQIST